MRIWKRVCAFSRAALLALPAAAAARSSADVFTCHWAYDDMQRADGAVLLMRVLALVDQEHYREEKTVTLQMMDAVTGQAILPH